MSVLNGTGRDRPALVTPAVYPKMECSWQWCINCNDRVSCESVIPSTDGVSCIWSTSPSVVSEVDGCIYTDNFDPNHLDDDAQQSDETLMPTWAVALSCLSVILPLLGGVVYCVLRHSRNAGAPLPPFSNLDSSTSSPAPRRAFSSSYYSSSSGPSSSSSSSSSSSIPPPRPPGGVVVNNPSLYVYAPCVAVVAGVAVVAENDADDEMLVFELVPVATPVNSAEGGGEEGGRKAGRRG